MMLKRLTYICVFVYEYYFKHIICDISAFKSLKTKTLLSCLIRISQIFATMFKPREFLIFSKVGFIRSNGIISSLPSRSFKRLEKYGKHYMIRQRARKKSASVTKRKVNKTLVH